MSARETMFGEIVLGTDVEEAVLAQLQKWLADYVYEVERQHGGVPGTLPKVRSWEISSELSSFPEDQTPACVIVGTGIIEPPEPHGRGDYTARYRLTAAVHLTARGTRLARRLAATYAAAMRGVLLQQQELPGLTVRRIDLVAERYGPVESIDDRTAARGEIDLVVEVASYASRHQGPVEALLPPGEPPAPESPTWPEVDLVETQIVKTPVTESEP